jgi:hypothetical protein
MLTQFCLEKLKGRDHSEDLGVNGRIKSKLIFEKVELKGLGWIHLVQDKNSVCSL